MAVLQINRVSWDDEGFLEFATSLLERLRSYQGFEESLERTLGHFKLVAHEVRCYDDGTTVQFEDSKDLEELRADLRDFFRLHVSRLVSLTVSAYGTPAVGGIHPIVVESLLDHPKKSRGKGLFGSFARSPCRADSSMLRWVEQIGPVRLQCNHFHLLVSDEALTNPRRGGLNDFSILK